MKEIRLIDIVSWSCMFILLVLMIATCVGCKFTEQVDRALTVAEDASAAVKEIKEQVDDEDWLGITESILIGAGAVASLFAGKKGIDKLRNGKKNAV